MEGSMDSITKADGMGGVRLVHFPGSVRVVLDDNALAIIADALEFTADDSRAVADNRMNEGDRTGASIARAEAARMDMLAEVVRGSEVGSVELGEGRDPDRAHALVQALVDAGAQA
jgi:hypothetical protein